MRNASCRDSAMKQCFPSAASCFNKAPVNKMKTPALLNLLVAVTGTILSATAQTTNDMSTVIAPGAKLEKLSGEFQFAEGATCDAKGNVFFTDHPNARIMKWSVEGK